MPRCTARTCALGIVSLAISLSSSSAQTPGDPSSPSGRAAAAAERASAADGAAPAAEPRSAGAPGALPADGGVGLGVSGETPVPADGGEATESTTSAASPSGADAAENPETGRASAEGTQGGPDAAASATPPARAAETVVTARRDARSASEQVIGREVVDAAPRQGAGDLLRLVPGVVASQHSGEGKAHQLFLRGHDALHGQDVELKVAGVPVNQVSHIHALGYADLNFLIPEAVRAIRVTEGTHRAHQGDFAVAGTVAFELGLEEGGILAAAEAGQFGRRRWVVGLASPESPSTFALVELSETDGFGPRRAASRASFLAQARFRVSDRARLELFAGSYAARFASPGVLRLDEVQSGRADFFAAPLGHQGGSATRHQLRATADISTTEGVLTFETFGVLGDTQLRNNFTGFLSDARGDGLEQTHEALTVGGEARFRRVLTGLALPARIAAAVGTRADFAAQTQQRYREIDGAAYEAMIDARIRQTDVYAWLEGTADAGAARLLAGLRVDALSVAVHDRLSPSAGGARDRRSAFGAHAGLKAGVSVALAPALTLFANYGDGFRSPQARSLSDGERAPFVSVRGVELGAAYAARTVAAQVAVFGSHVADDFFFDHSIGSTSFIGPTARGGISGSALWRPDEALTVAASATYAHAAALDRGTLLPYFAPLVGRSDASWTRPVSVFGVTTTIKAGLGLTGLGPRPLPFGEWSSPVFLADVHGSLRVGPVTVGVDVSNLLDARWRDGEFVYPSRLDPALPATRVPSRHFTAGPPRAASLSLEVHL